VLRRGEKLNEASRYAIRDGSLHRDQGFECCKVVVRVPVKGHRWVRFGYPLGKFCLEDPVRYPVSELDLRE